MSNFPNDSSPNPYAATSTLETNAATTPQRSYGGIGRLAYFGYSFLAGIIYNIVVAGIGFAAGGGGGGGGAGNGAGGAALGMIMLALLAYFAALLTIIAQRMINAGYSPWWCLGAIVPIVNLLVAFRCIVYPEGYADHRTLDTAGKIMVGLFIAFLLLMVGLVVFAVTSGQ